jgi:hypothetical protein
MIGMAFRRRWHHYESFRVYFSLRRDSMRSSLRQVSFHCIMPALVVMANTVISFISLVGFSRPPLANFYSRLPLASHSTVLLLSSHFHRLLLECCIMMLGEAGLSLQNATVRMMFPRVRALKEKETYAIVISSTTENLAHQPCAFHRGGLYFFWTLQTSGWRGGESCFFDVVHSGYTKVDDWS